MNDKFDGEHVTYFPGRGDPDYAVWRGITFNAGEPVFVTDQSMVEAARGNRFFHVGEGKPQKDPLAPPVNAKEYRAHVVRWLKDTRSVDQLVGNWAGDRTLRQECEIGLDDIQWLGTLVEPKLRELSRAEGLDPSKVAEIWISHGILELPWRA